MNRNSVKFLLLAISFCLAIIAPVAVHAAQETSEEQSHAEGAHEETLSQKIGKWLNFIVLVTLVYLFITKTLRVPAKFKDKAVEIEQAVESARSAKAEAEQRLQELDKRMLEMNDEVARIKAEASAAADEEKRRILEAAQKEAQRIVEMAHRELEAEVRLAKKALRRHVADLAVRDGRAIVKQEINDDDHQRLINNYIEEFGK